MMIQICRRRIIMIVHLIGMFVALSSAWPGCCDPQTTASLSHDAPVLDFKETRFDFGLLPPDKPTVLQHDFLFKNSGKRTLAIKSVGTACRTATMSPKPKINPQESSFVRLTTTLPPDYTKSEQFERVVEVETSDPAHPMVELNIKARFAYSLRCRPEQLDFGSMPAGSTLEKTLTIFSLLDSGFQIRGCECSGNTFKASLEKTTTTLSPVLSDVADSGKPGKSVQGYLVKIKAEPDGKREGLVADNLQLKTDRPDIPNINIPLTVKVIAAINVEPTSLFLGIIHSADPIEKDVNLLTSIAGLRIEKISTNLKGLKIERFERAKGCRIHLTFDPSQADGAIEGDLVIQTSQRSTPEIKVPIQGVVNLKK